MASKIRDLMTTDPIVCDSSTSAAQAAQRMRDDDVGDVLVEDGGTLRGIVTDRDITLRVVAEGVDPDEITVGTICSGGLVSVGPDDDLGDAVEILREKHVRRVPVVEDGTAVGMISIGDLAVTLDPDSALADISAAPRNN